MQILFISARNSRTDQATVAENRMLLNYLAGRPPICASSISSCAGRGTLRSSAHGNLAVLFARSATMQTCSFSVVGPTAWNGLPIDLRHLPNGACSQFHHLLKTVLFRLAWVRSASE